FLSVYDIPVAFADCARLNPSSLRTGVRFRDRKRLQTEFSPRYLRQVTALLLLIAVAQKRAHRVHLSVAGPRVRAGPADFLQDDAGLGDAHTGAAIFLRNKSGQIPGLGKDPNKLFWVFLNLVDLAPVGVWKIPAQLANALPNRLLVLLAGISL